MRNKPIHTCSKESCHNCSIRDKTNCHFHPHQLFRFYVIVLPSFIIGGIGIYQYSMTGLFGWLMIIALFFILIEIRVLCSHCPHYNESSGILRCWANYGIPKLFRYRPGPMNIFEKALLIAGFIAVWGYPVVFIILSGNLVLLGVYVLFAALFFILLRRFHCRKCINLSCPLNGTDKKVKEEFLRNNAVIRNAWLLH